MTHTFELDPTRVLGVAPGASLEEIRDAYRSQSKKYHPDHGGDEWVFRMVARSYELLSRARVAGRLSGEARAAAPAGRAGACAEGRRRGGLGPCRRPGPGRAPAAAGRGRVAPAAHGAGRPLPGDQCLGVRAEPELQPERLLAGRPRPTLAGPGPEPADVLARVAAGFEAALIATRPYSSAGRGRARLLQRLARLFQCPSLLGGLQHPPPGHARPRPRRPPAHPRDRHPARRGLVIGTRPRLRAATGSSPRSPGAAPVRAVPARSSQGRRPRNGQDTTLPWPVL